MKTGPQNVTALRAGDGTLNNPDQRMHTYEVHPREDRYGVDLISDVLPFGRLLYQEILEAVNYAKFYSRAQGAMIRVYDSTGSLIETHEHNGNFKEW